MKTYKERILFLIDRLYVPGTPNLHDLKTTVAQIYEDLCNVVPANAFDEFDVTETLEQLGFEPQYSEKQDDKGGSFNDMQYFYYLKRKTEA